MRSPLCSAYLRVYEPVHALPTADRDAVARAETGTLPGPSGSAGTIAGLIASEECREIYERTVGGVRYVCLARPRLRTLLGLVSFGRSLPDGVAKVFFSEREISEAREELEELRARRPDLRPSMLQNPWHVPLWWFVPFGDRERRIVHDGDHPRIRYEMPMAGGLDRVGRCLAVIEAGVVHPSVVGMVHELQGWLSTFHAESLIELDYASVARLFDGDELADDHSAADVWQAIDALGQGDGMRAALYYQRVRDRWAATRARESLN